MCEIEDILRKSIMELEKALAETEHILREEKQKNFYIKKLLKMLS